MADRLSFDTTFLIDFQRERARRREGPAHEFLRANQGAQLCVPVVALGEFAEGFDAADHPLVEILRATHEVLPADDEVALVYARITRRLRREGRLIGANDLWIGATALRNGLDLVTADVEHFSRVDGLKLRTYR